MANFIEMLQTNSDNSIFRTISLYSEIVSYPISNIKNISLSHRDWQARNIIISIALSSYAATYYLTLDEVAWPCGWKNSKNDKHFQQTWKVLSKKS